ncbi:MAG TPA: hypothetical protein VIF85_10870 [Gaiellaceae bacterium]
MDASGLSRPTTEHVLPRRLAGEDSEPEGTSQRITLLTGALHAFLDGEPAGNLTRDNIVDDITLYWLTGTGASAARWYWEFARAQAAAGAAGQAPPPAVPVGFTTFPGEVFPAPLSWVEVVFPGLAYFNEVDRSGHFPAWEEPELFSDEIRAAFSSLR